MSDDYQKTKFIKDTYDVYVGTNGQPFGVQATAGVKFDNGKVPLELLSPVALTEIGKVLAFGQKKYDSHNWRKGMKWSRVAGAALRHLLAWLGGEDKDPESGLPHLAHCACCLMFLLEYETTHKDKDDRYKHV